MLRKIVQIDEEKCDGCGVCVPSCVEGAIQIIDGKARLVKDEYCDGLGACLNDCPKDAIKVIEREADPFNVEAAENHVKRMKKDQEPVLTGCPGTRARKLTSKASNQDMMDAKSGDVQIKIKSQLSQWPVQLSLISPHANYFEDSHLLITADCVPFAYADYHLDILKNKTVVVGCPKLDDINEYIEKLTGILYYNNIKSITCAFMEVPCCNGIIYAVNAALEASGKEIPIEKIRITIDGEKQILA